MKKYYRLLALLMGITIFTVGCGSSKTETTQTANKEPGETDDTYEVPEETGVVIEVQEGAGETAVTDGQDADVNIGGYFDTSEFAIMKDDFRTYGFCSGYYAGHKMTIENNSKDRIHVTGARVIVNNYEALEPGSYVMYRAGGGEQFDPFFGLYAEVYGDARSYDACEVKMDGVSYLNKDNITYDTVLNLDIEPADAQKFCFFVDFMDAGIYDYELVIDYEYNGKMEHVSGGADSVLYENDGDAAERALDEFHDNSDYYLNHMW